MILAGTQYQNLLTGEHTFSFNPTAGATAIFLLIAARKDNAEAAAGRISSMEFGAATGTLVARLNEQLSHFTEVWKIDLTVTTANNIAFVYSTARPAAIGVSVAVVAVDGYNRSTPLDLGRSVVDHAIPIGTPYSHQVTLAAGEAAVDVVGNVEYIRAYSIGVGSAATPMSPGPTNYMGASYIEGDNIVGTYDFQWNVGEAGVPELSSHVMVLRAAQTHPYVVATMRF